MFGFFFLLVWILYYCCPRGDERVRDDPYQQYTCTIFTNMFAPVFWGAEIHDREGQVFGLILLTSDVVVGFTSLTTVDSEEEKASAGPM